MAVFQQFVEGGPSGDELDRARDYLAGVFPLRMETTSQLAGRLSELQVYGLPEDYHHGYRDRIRAVDVASVREAIRRDLHPARAAIVVVGDADQIAPEVEALGLGPVEIRDS